MTAHIYDAIVRLEEYWATNPKTALIGATAVATLLGYYLVRKGQRASQYARLRAAVVKRQQSRQEQCALMGIERRKDDETKRFHILAMKFNDLKGTIFSKIEDPLK